MSEQAVQLVRHDETGLTPLTPVTPQAMLSVAVARGDTALAEKLMDLADRWEARNSRKAFDAAIAAAKAEIPVIIKNRTVDFTSQKGRTHYRHEDLAEIARTIDPILARHGLSYRFRTTSEPGNPVVVTCILSHEDGHSEENTLSAGRDESGNKNSIQAVGSTITYLQRYTLKAALGLAASEDDDAATVTVGDKIAPDQLAHLIQLADDVGADKEKFCKYMRVASMAEIPASRLAQAIDALNSKRKS